MAVLEDRGSRGVTGKVTAQARQRHIPEDRRPQRRGTGTEPAPKPQRKEQTAQLVFISKFPR